MNDTPLLETIGEDDTQIYVWCPRCKHTHSHGLPSDYEVGAVVAHCVDGSLYPYGYLIKRSATQAPTHHGLPVVIPVDVDARGRSIVPCIMCLKSHCHYVGRGYTLKQACGKRYYVLVDGGV